jgi:hypothetical protein
MFKFRLLLGPDRMYIICCSIRTLKKNTKLLTLYNNKPQHQETNTIKNGTNRVKMKQTELKMKQINIILKPKLGLKRCYKCHVMQLNYVDLLLLKIVLHWFDSTKTF